MTSVTTRTSFDKGKIKIVLLESIHASAAETFRACGYSRIDEHTDSPGEHALAGLLADAHIVGIRSGTKITRPVLDAAPRLMAIGCFCIGTNQVDLDTAQTRGIPVFNAPFSNTRSVAELVLADIIFLLRGIPERNALAHRGIWRKTSDGAREARGKVLGIVGYGHIGTQVGLLAESLGMQVMFHDVETKLALGNARPMRSLRELLERADVVTLHVPATPQTVQLMDASRIAQMRTGAALINASRGTVVDVDALSAALRSGHLSGAALDVFPSEPKSNDDTFESPLRGLDNAVLTPHIGGATVEAQQNIGIEVADKLVRYSDNGSTLTSVNFPEVALPEHEGQHRFLHIHHNQPGMLSAINDVFSRQGVNIAAEHLQTSGNIGYVVIDAELSDGIETGVLKHGLDAIAGTIRTRLLY
jgi:D-3-phosphoglycerate dehydrogenase / 2-oxoglutarate reductase